MEKTHLTEAQSLELITSMIQDSRSRLARNSGTPFLIWGYTTVAVSLFNALALYLGWSHAWAWSWFTIPVVGWLAGAKRPQLHRPHRLDDMGCNWLIVCVVICRSRCLWLLN